VFKSGYRYQVMIRVKGWIAGRLVANREISRQLTLLSELSAQRIRSITEEAIFLLYHALPRKITQIPLGLLAIPLTQQRSRNSPATLISSIIIPSIHRDIPR
jgi:hypothetical protein